MMPTLNNIEAAGRIGIESSDPAQMIDDKPPLSKSVQVSFRLPNNPQMTSSAGRPEPRNRRRLFRDMSYTSRAIKRDGRSSANGSTIRQSFSDRAPRRQDSFRKRRGDRSKAGGLRARFRTFCEERTRLFFRNEQERQPIDQYYISPSDGGTHSIFDAFVRLFTLPFGELIVWVYETSFGNVLVLFLLLYLLIVYLFVILLYFADQIAETACVNNQVGTLDDDSTTSEHFELLFELSWTTLTTVGYGNVGIPDETGCYIVRLACSIEALLGIGYVSACSGLFYVKLLKTLARAHVTFSSTMCIQYGRGLETGIKRYSALTNSALTNSQTSFSSVDSKQKKQQQQPFPVIEFRVVNDRANLPSGVNEIWDAEVGYSSCLTKYSDSDILPLLQYLGARTCPIEL
ncbi:hypothetical protein THAOC_36002 [Thalassiosira oceanica]|uniref:Uncharacterized protein n=1 Tax=Thalassiosira oceanica TaxID=159749 RepID=K0R028_THAOC|nr:hypothetical protein THAOC_36002 [Thalassiosira oceanica]|eukprot:EJK45383.1 hypothetical protein THAOC_36002 [Thalassiosira oceanica]